MEHAESKLAHPTVSKDSPCLPWEHGISINYQEGEAERIFKYLSPLRKGGSAVPAEGLVGAAAQSLQHPRVLWAAITPKGHRPTRITTLHSSTLTPARTGIARAALGLNFQRPNSCPVKGR